VALQERKAQLQVILDAIWTCPKGSRCPNLHAAASSTPSRPCPPAGCTGPRSNGLSLRSTHEATRAFLDPAVDERQDEYANKSTMQKAMTGIEAAFA
jgi:hypothetical protein